MRWNRSVYIHKNEFGIIDLQCLIRHKTQRNLTRSMLSLVLLIESLQFLEWSFMSALPSLNLFCHSRTCVYDLKFSLSTSWSISSACDESFLQPDQKIIYYLVFNVRSSLLITERSEKRSKQRYAEKNAMVAET